MQIKQPAARAVGTGALHHHDLRAQGAFGDEVDLDRVGKEDVVLRQRADGIGGEAVTEARVDPDARKRAAEDIGQLAFHLGAVAQMGFVADEIVMPRARRARRQRAAVIMGGVVQHHIAQAGKAGQPRDDGDKRPGHPLFHLRGLSSWVWFTEAGTAGRQGSLDL